MGVLRCLIRGAGRRRSTPLRINTEGAESTEDTERKECAASGLPQVSFGGTENRQECCLDTIRLHGAAWGTCLLLKSGGKTAALQKRLRFPGLIAFCLGVAVAEFEALEFSGGGFGKFLQELDPARAFVAADT